MSNMATSIGLGTENTQTESEASRDQKIKQIGELVCELPDAGLSTVASAIKRFLELWSEDNDGVEIHVIPIEISAEEDSEDENEYLTDVNNELAIKTEPNEGNQNIVNYCCH